MKTSIKILCSILILIIIPNALFAQNSKPELTLQLGHSSLVDSVAFSPEGRYAISGNLDKTLKLWEFSTGREIRTFKGHSN